MLKTRFITTCVLLPIVLTIVLYCSTWVINLMSVIVFSLAAWEWTKLINLKNKFLSAFNILLVIICCLFLKQLNLSLFWLCLASLLWWLIGLLAVIYYPIGAKFFKKSFIGFCIGFILFVPSILSIDWLHSTNMFGPIWVVFLCFLVWSADIGAYLVGKRWGNKKLLQKISANKTWFGVLGGFLFAFVVVILFKIFLLQEQQFYKLMMLGIIVVISSIIGDLTESLFKRIRKVKNSGSLLPGHGGMLDRVDGLLAAIPTFIVGLNFLHIQGLNYASW